MNSQIRWFKSSYCDTAACVEISVLPGGAVGLRDGKDPDGAFLRFPIARWNAFADLVKRDTLSR
ncbi:DUF397 domain-containing protein [Catenuloplanes sp. NPDC051500]|uniref:DUF397 domain-containing protein n=1 Tax=Catenuloplanes sp. NPDC051500 TaxID=3363959 RepID=UPI0037BDEEB8